MLYQDLGIEHGLTPPRSPQTNSMVERFNGRIDDVLQTHQFNYALDRKQKLLRSAVRYNPQLPQSALLSRTPSHAMNQWHEFHLDKFNKRPPNLPERDT